MSALLLLLVLSPAQDELVSHPDFFGNSLACVGDVDGDGVPDAAVGAPIEDRRGSVRVFSGADGSVIHRVFGLRIGQQFGQAVAGLGDVDRDGVPDFAVAASGHTGDDSPPGSLRCLSGRDASVLWRVMGPANERLFGDPLALIGDVDGDDFPDLALGTRTGGRWITSPGVVRVFSGRTGAFVREIRPAGPADGYPQSLAGAGDVDGDGRADLLIGAGTRAAPEVEVRSGADGRLLYAVTERHADPRAPQTYAEVSALASLGDVDGDGVADWAVSFNDADAVARLRIHSGVDGSVFHDRDEAHGWSLAAAGDVYGDGVPDVLFGELTTDFVHWGTAGVRSGATGDVLYEFEGSRIQRYLGYEVASAGDVTGDGRPDLLIGAFNPWTPGAPGYAQWRSGSDGSLLREVNAVDDEPHRPLRSERPRPLDHRCTR